MPAASRASDTDGRVCMMLRVTKNDVRGAYRYYGLFYTRPDRVLSKMYILRTDRADESVLCRDSADG